MIRILIVLGLLVGGHATGQTASGGRVRGVVVDATGAGLPRATIRLLQVSATNHLIERLRADDKGRFQSEAVRSGSYLLIAWMPGFQARRLSSVTIDDGETTDVGRILLDLAGCDSPGVICEDLSPGPREHVLAEGYLYINLDCGLDLRRNRLDCPASSKPTRLGTSMDLVLTKSAAGVYITAVNGAMFSAPNSQRGDCSSATFDQAKIRFDGLGPGDEICALTHGGLLSHLFLMDDVELNSMSVRIWQVLRKK